MASSTLIPLRAGLREFYSITELTREFGVTTRALRFYEQEGLLQPVRQGRARLFRSSDRQLLRQILRGRRLGFSVSEIREMIALGGGVAGDPAALRQTLRRIETQREVLRQKRRDLEDALAELDRTEEACVERLAELGVTT